VNAVNPDTINPLYHPLRRMLADIVALQGENPGNTQTAQEYLRMARERLSLRLPSTRQSIQADEAACFTLLHGIHTEILNQRHISSPVPAVPAERISQDPVVQKVFTRLDNLLFDRTKTEVSYAV
jgi:hypothetical protein